MWFQRFEEIFINSNILGINDILSQNYDENSSAEAAIFKTMNRLPLRHEPGQND